MSNYYYIITSILYDQAINCIWIIIQNIALLYFSVVLFLKASTCDVSLKSNAKRNVNSFLFSYIPPRFFPSFNVLILKWGSKVFVGKNWIEGFVSIIVLMWLLMHKRSRQLWRREKMVPWYNVSSWAFRTTQHVEEEMRVPPGSFEWRIETKMLSCYVTFSKDVFLIKISPLYKREIIKEVLRY